MENVITLQYMHRSVAVLSPSPPLSLFYFIFKPNIQNIQRLSLLALQWEPFTSWASEASPTLGCSIEISRHICWYVCMYVCCYVYKKYVCQKVWAELRGQNTHILKVSFGQLKQSSETHIIHFRIR